MRKPIKNKKMSRVMKKRHKDGVYDAHLEDLHSKISGIMRAKFDPTFVQRFWNKVNLHGGYSDVCSRAFGECHLWEGADNGTGYGQYRVPGIKRPILATHVSWYLATGELPKGDLIHRCDVRRCINTNHLIDAEDPKSNGYDRRMKKLGGVQIP